MPHRPRLFAWGLALAIAAVAGRPVHAHPFGALIEFGLPEPKFTALCQTMLLVRHPDRAAALDVFRAHRVRRLGIRMAAPSTAKRLASNQSAVASHGRLASHLRGVEARDLEANPANQNEGRPRIAGATFIGADAIAQYYRNLATLRERAEEFIRMDPRDQAASGAYNANILGAMATSLLATGLAIDLSSHWMIPLTAFTGLILHHTYSANRFRFVRDRDANAFDARVAAYLQRPEAEQRESWEFGSRTYGVPAEVVDSLWAGHQTRFGKAIESFVFRQIFPYYNPLAVTVGFVQHGPEVARTVRRLTRDVYVTVDRLLDFDEVAGAPRLTVVLRTSTTPPARFARQTKSAGASVAASVGTARAAGAR